MNSMYKEINCFFIIIEFSLLLALVNPKESESFKLQKLKIWKDSNLALRIITYQPFNESFLTYMLSLKRNSSKLLNEECEQKTFKFSYYNQILYSAICYQGHINKNDTCTSDDFACTIDTFVRQQENLIEQNKKLKDYQETVFEEIPFCTVTVCPVIDERETNLSIRFSLLDCMPNWCQIGFYTLLSIDILLGISIAFSNTLIIYVNVKSGFPKNVGGFSTLSLALSDAIIGYFSQVCTVCNLLKQYRVPVTLLNEHTEIFEIITGMIQTVSMSASLFTIFTIAIFRYIAIAQPGFYRNQKANITRISKYFFLFYWIISILLSLLSVYKVINVDKFHRHLRGLTLPLQFGALHQAIIFIVIFTLWLLYFRSYKVVKKVTTQSMVKTNSNSHNSIYKMLKNLRQMALIYSACYFPLIITQSFQQYPTLHLQTYDEFSLLGNSSWNFSILFSSRLVVFSSFLKCIVYYYSEVKPNNIPKRPHKSTDEIFVQHKADLIEINLSKRYVSTAV